MAIPERFSSSSKGGPPAKKARPVNDEVLAFFILYFYYFLYFFEYKNYKTAFVFEIEIQKTSQILIKSFSKLKKVHVCI